MPISPLVASYPCMALLSCCHAHVHRSHVVTPSGVAQSSRNKGRGGGGKKVPVKKPPSLASRGMGESSSAPRMSEVHVGSLILGAAALRSKAVVGLATTVVVAERMDAGT